MAVTGASGDLGNAGPGSTSVIVSHLVACGECYFGAISSYCNALLAALAAKANMFDFLHLLPHTSNRPRCNSGVIISPSPSNWPLKTQF